MSRDWIRHIRHTHAEMKEKAWCGRKLPQTEWAFVDIDHAAYASMHNDRLAPCKKCIAAAIKALRHNGD